VKIGITCYASVGGSGVVATELGLALARRGHEVHLVSSEKPFRWKANVPGLTFHRVTVPSYPLFREPQYVIALTNSLVQVARERQLDVIHAHYAVPHATAAYLAHQVAASTMGDAAPRTVTTLHGTDITLVGTDPSFASVVAFSIEQSHGVTTVSESLRQDTIRALGIQREIRVIHNFLDCERYRRSPDPVLRARLLKGADAVVMHVSNFRPVKRVDRVLETFVKIRECVNARLVMVGNGPDRAALERSVTNQGLSSHVDFVGERDDLVALLSSADLFLLPSAQESFGMAAMEAMACSTPVVASRVGGLPEVIEDGETGFLCDEDDVQMMAERGVQLLTDRALHERISGAGAILVRNKFCEDRIVPQYLKLYEDVTGRTEPT
jgi:N-acetyl-alpha-D-glucosaminyl L-malate synthase BshA